MKPIFFCYFLQGFAEMNSDPPNAEQWKIIQEHLALVFNKVTGKGLSGESFATASDSAIRTIDERYC
jgi:hypothetical protein